MINVLNFGKSCLYALFIYLGIKTGTAMILFWLMVIDSVLGIGKALRLGEKFSFKILLWGMITKISILLIPLVVALVGKGLNLDFTYFVIAVINILIVNEGISAITNILSMKTKTRIENADYITMLLKLIRRFFAGIIQRFFSTLEEAKKDNQKKY